jgi:hypothetical protein
MMCACDKVKGEKFLPHQLSQGVRLETQERIPVTLGFVSNVCEQCRDGKETPHPVASITGRTSKIKRYYWRELAFRKMELYEHLAGSADGYLNKHPGHPSDIYNLAEAQALEEIKQLHENSPRYSFHEESAESLLRRCQVKIRDVRVDYVKTSGKKALIKHGTQNLHAEQFAEALYKEMGYCTLLCESVPFHVIFGVFTWQLIQDPGDPLGRVVQFGARDSYERDRSKESISTVLPSDFGTSGYGVRRGSEIAAHIKLLEERADDLGCLFDYWLGPSWGLRQYLWAHRDTDVETARKIIAAIPGGTTIKIIDYMLGAYWSRYLGWPDVLATRDGEILFIEVKSSNDKLSQEQKHWVDENFKLLKLPFELLKLHRVAQQSVQPDGHASGAPAG